MSAEQTKQAVSKMVEAFNARQFDTLAGTVFNPDITYTQNGRPGDLSKWIQDSRDCVVSFPDARLTIESQEVAGDQVVTHLSLAGTHLGMLGEIPPTGKPFKIGATITNRTENGLIVDYDEQVDEMALMQQLGFGAAEEG